MFMESSESSSSERLSYEAKISIRGLWRRLLESIDRRMPVADTGYEYVFPYAQYTGPVDSTEKALDIMEEFNKDYL